MKVKVAALRKNPFRDFRVWPLDREQLSSVERSIRRTGSWDTMLARPGKVKGTYELAFGHHRWAVLRRRDPKGEVDIPVKDLSDDEMVRIMTSESAPQWNESKAAQIGAVRTLRRYLAKKPPRGGSLPPRKSGAPGAKTMLAFLGPGPWTEKSFANVLEVVAPLERGEVAESAIEPLPSLSDARRLMPHLSKARLDEQPAIVADFLKTGRVQSRFFGPTDQERIQHHLRRIGTLATALRDYIVYELFKFKDRLDLQENVRGAEDHLEAARRLLHALVEVLSLTDKARQKATKAAARGRTGRKAP